VALYGPMPPRRQAAVKPDEERHARLSARVVDLETRVRLLEAHVRQLKAQVQPAEGAAPAGTTKSSRTRPRPRCPGCLLELPKGRRGETCVWCGFMFSAVGGRTFK
jgi:hypothetical protein